MSLREQYVRANGLRFHLLTTGPEEGPLVLLLHGFPEMAFSWRFQLEALGGAGYRAVALDMRGFNLTDKPRGLEAYRYDALVLDVEELLNTLDAARAVVIGHDWGGIVAWWFAMDYGERVEKLVILNAPHPGLWRKGMTLPAQWLRSWYIGAFQLPWLPEKVFQRNPGLLAASMRATAGRRDACGNAELAEYARAFAQPGAMHAALNYYRALVRWGFWRALKPIDAPTLMIWGELDIALDRRLTLGTEQFVRDFRIHYLPECGHWVQQEAADKVNQILLEFVGPATDRGARGRWARS